MAKTMVKIITGWILLFSLTQTVFSQESVQVQVYYGGYAAECSWEIINSFDGSVVLNGGPGSNNSYSYNGNISIYPGEYVFKAYDSEGDGWTFANGWYEVTPALGVASGQVLFQTGYEQTTAFSVFSSSATDIGAVEWIAPVSSAGLTSSETVNIKVRNYGTTAITGMDLFYCINGGSSYVTETYSGTLNSGDVLDFSFSQTANFSSTGTYSCEFGASVLGDAVMQNDTALIDIESIPSINSFPWSESFSAWPPQDWTIQGANSWASYQFSSAYCNFFYWPAGNAEMLTPPINLYSPGNLSFDWSSGFDAGYLNDELNVSVSIDNGQTWQVVWSKTGVELNSNDGASYTTPGSFITQNIDLTQYAGSIVYVKFDGVTGYGPNVFVDNVVIDLNPAYDLSVVEWLTPGNTGCNLSSSEQVSIRIKNFGAIGVSNFNVAYSIDGGSTFVTETISSTIASGATLDYTFTGLADFSVPGTYNCLASVNFASDINPANDQLTSSVKNLEIINSFPFTEDFESGATTFLDFTSGDYASVAVFNEGSNYALKMEGDASGTGWVGSSSSTTSADAWNINSTHHGLAYTCLVDASQLSTAELLIDLKQYYKFGPTYSWFRVLINGVPTADINGQVEFNPTTSYNDPYATIKFDLTAFAGTQFEVAFQASNRYSSNSHPPGNVAFVDNFILREIPPPDVAVLNLVAPLSSCDLGAGSVIIAEIQNLGGGDISNFDISYVLNGGTPIVETITSVITSGSVYQHTFAATADLTATGVYTIDIVVNLVSDQNATNDNGAFTVEHLLPTPLTINGLNATYCYYDAAVTLSGSPSGGTFSGDGITGNTFDPAQAGSGSHDITYTYDDLQTGCQSAITETVMVNGSSVSFTGLYNGPTTVPVLVQVYYNSFWVSQQSWEIVDEFGTVHLSGPAGTTQNGYSYDGYINLPLGNYTFFANDSYGDGWMASWYNVTPDFGTGTGQQNYIVPGPNQPTYSQSTSFTVGGLSGYCLNDAAVTLIGSPAGGTFSGQGMNGNSFDPATAGAGTHTITYAYTDNGCAGSQSQQVIVQPAISIDLGADQVACVGDNILLDAGVAETYLWTDGSTNQTLSVNQTGLYGVTVTNLAGCEASDEVQVTFNALPIIDFGADQDVCEGSTVILDAGVADSYLWSTGETTQTISVQTTGTYGVTITTNSCSASDDVLITFHQASLDLGSDLEICAGSDVLIDAGNGYTSYLWSDNSIGSSLLVSAAATYSLTVTDQYGCTATDAVDVIVNQLPVVNLGNDTTIGSDILILNAGIGYASYVWSDGSFGEVVFVDGGNLPNATYTYSVSVVDANGCEGSDAIDVTVLVLEDIQTITVPQGWSIFSTYINPFDTSIADVLSPIVATTSIVKNGAGDVYWPGFNFNGIGNITIGEGYQILTTAISTFDVIGLKVVPETTSFDIPLGWSIIGYLRETPASAITMLSAVVSDVKIMKSGAGAVYWPDVFYNGIGDMMPGEGYQILTTAPIQLTYPANGPVNPSAKSIKLSNKHLIDKSNTGNNMTIAVPLSSWDVVPNINDEIGIYNQANELCGSTVFDGGISIITVWGQDEFAPSNGMIAAEQYSLKIYNVHSNVLTDLYISSFKEGDGLYENNDIEVVGKVAINKSNSNDLMMVENYPNPFNSITNIKIYLPAADQIGLKVYDLSGKLIVKHDLELLSAGWHEFKISADQLVSGSYIYKVVSSKETILKRMTVVK